MPMRISDFFIVLDMAVYATVLKCCNGVVNVQACPKQEILPLLACSWGRTSDMKCMLHDASPPSQPPFIFTFSVCSAQDVSGWRLATRVGGALSSPTLKLQHDLSWANQNPAMQSTLHVSRAGKVGGSRFLSHAIVHPSRARSTGSTAAAHFLLPWPGINVRSVRSQNFK